MLPTQANYTRMSLIGLLAAALIVAIVIVAGQQIVVGVWKLALVAIAAYGGYWLDRELFPYARPHGMAEPDSNDGMWNTNDPTGHVFVGSMIRRAAIVVGTMVAVALAL